MAEAESGETLANLIRVLGEAPDGSSPRFPEDLNRKSEKTESDAEAENRAIIKLRTMWATWVLVFIAVIILFDIVLICLYGSGLWDFKDPKVVMVVIADNFLKIIGLGILITHSLFKKIYN